MMLDKRIGDEVLNPNEFAVPLADHDYRLSTDDVDVWRCRIADAAAAGEDFFELLSQDERQRADRFRVEHARTQFMVARGALRILLSRYLRIPPAEIDFHYTDRGKPFVETSISFNIAHSENICLIAITKERAVGVDVEAVRPDVDHAAVAARIFPPGSLARFSAAAAGDKVRVFFELWTRNEAYLKATGDGLFSSRAQEPTRGWSFTTLAPDPGYIGTAALNSEKVKIKLWHLTTPLLSTVFRNYDDVS
jgi:4'-phosphopantetheinyl transferase